MCVDGEKKKKKKMGKKKKKKNFRKFHKCILPCVSMVKAKKKTISQVPSAVCVEGEIKKTNKNNQNNKIKKKKKKKKYPSACDNSCFRRKWQGGFHTCHCTHLSVVNHPCSVLPCVSMVKKKKKKSVLQRARVAFWVGSASNDPAASA